jgi:hypothetical protein
MMREASALLCMTRHESEIDLRLKVVELKLHTPEPWNHVGRDLLAKVAHADGAASEHAEEGTHKEDQDHHEGLLDVVPGSTPVCTMPGSFGKVSNSHMAV